MKTCSSCKERKPLSDFPKHNGFKDGRNSKCKVCKSAQQRLHYSENGDRKAYSYENMIKYKYGLTPEDYLQLLESQKHCCAICGNKPEKLVVDHCHTTGIVRGLLCIPCNTGLGKLGDSVAGLTRALNYLRKVG